MAVKPAELSSHIQASRAACVNMTLGCLIDANESDKVEGGDNDERSASTLVSIQVMDARTLSLVMKTPASPATIVAIRDSPIRSTEAMTCAVAADASSTSAVVENDDSDENDDDEKDDADVNVDMEDDDASILDRDETNVSATVADNSTVDRNVVTASNAAEHCDRAVDDNSLDSLSSFCNADARVVNVRALASVESEALYNPLHIVSRRANTDR